jgi:ATP phosphoribosyltransferase regulatory subunit HisZ
MNREEVFDLMATKLRYPTGARPLLVEETARRKRLEQRIVALLEASGFAEIALPVLDFAEPYASISGAAYRQSYRFTDRDGELVALRSDFTPMVARALAPALDGNLPLRVFYRGDVVRCGSTTLGANREMFQIGAELVGDASPSADREMLHLAASIAALFAPAPLIACTSLTSKVGSDPTPLVNARFVEHEEEEPGPSYYTGLRFWVYGEDRRSPIAKGGRYDSLYAHFGADAPAIGFTFTVPS